jgi:hypothetical protein
MNLIHHILEAFEERDKAIKWKAACEKLLRDAGWKERYEWETETMKKDPNWWKDFMNSRVRSHGLRKNMNAGPLYPNVESPTERRGPESYSTLFSNGPTLDASYLIWLGIHTNQHGDLLPLSWELRSTRVRGVLEKGFSPEELAILLKRLPKNEPD